MLETPAVNSIDICKAKGTRALVLGSVCAAALAIANSHVVQHLLVRICRCHRCPAMLGCLKSRKIWDRSKPSVSLKTSAPKRGTRSLGEVIPQLLRFLVMFLPVYQNCNPLSNRGFPYFASYFETGVGDSFGTKQCESDFGVRKHLES